MSSSVGIGYGKQLVWAYDVVTSVFLKYLVDVATPRIPVNAPWLGDAVEHWRVQTLLADCFGVTLKETWSTEQIDVVIALIEKVCGLLGECEEISAKEIEGWELLDGQRLFARRMPMVRTKPVINLGQAIISMLKGSLPEPPSGTWWWFGIEDVPGTIQRRTD